jgi:hypothetical protein
MLERDDDVAEIAASVAVENRFTVLAVLDGQTWCLIAASMQWTRAMTLVIAGPIRAGVPAKSRGDLARGGPGHGEG